jgi:uncharacterized protein (DUF4415 family)
MPSDRPRRPQDPLAAAEAVFAKKTRAPDIRASAIPHARELVSLRIDRDVLEHFQEAGPGWQDRMNDALRAAAIVDGLQTSSTEDGS